MKKILIAILVIIISLGALVGYAFQTPMNPDKYDSENYIGAADVQKILTLQMGIGREEMSTFTIEGDRAFMSGVISSDTIRQVKKLIKDYPKVETIQMVNVEGSVDDESNLIASRLVRDAGLNIYLAKDGHIASGGTDFFCAGVERTVEEGAMIGVHSWAGDGVTNAALLPKSHEEHKKYIKYYREMEMPDPEGFYFFTINAAEADGMHYMSIDEMVQYGLIEK